MRVQQQQQRMVDEFRWLHMRDLAPEEFLSWLIEWGTCALRARGNAERVPEAKITRSL
ncbi:MULTISPECIES: hypothetical protein [unclassified Pseudomonas]|jgi:hypothetical protein|uniref:hypothetical protein n=1 Tax=unclassified Pseudomonas TaxID=196821 RepID=UPI001CE4A165|nr:MULTISPECIES: hypothetical protein [unclassified Pseudomonas]MBS6037112.1 hypothetical protein [Pseudomonas sp.]CAH0650913.1 hypothetical protein PSNVIR_05221 [Pseudomonas sp. Nvir]